jgi:hypothetical protein
LIFDGAWKLSVAARMNKGEAVMNSSGVTTFTVGSAFTAGSAFAGDATDPMALLFCHVLSRDTSLSRKGKGLEELVRQR